MCGRFTLTKPDKLEARFVTKNRLPLFESNWNIAPSSSIPTITRNSPNRITMMRWGFLFSRTSKYGTINIRSETTKEKPFFRKFLEDKRCLIPADSFYEWGIVNLEGKNEKYPFNFYLDNRKIFGFAGLYNDFADAEGKPFYSCAILTTYPNKIVAKVHNRMPVIINDEDEDFWLHPENKNTEKLRLLLKPYPEEDMKMHIVSKLVNNTANNSPVLIDKQDLPFNTTLM